MKEHKLNLEFTTKPEKDQLIDRWFIFEVCCFDADHERIEIRRASVCHVVDWLAADRTAPGESRFEGLATIGMDEAEVEKDGNTSRSRRFYISSAHLTAAQLSRAARAHRGIENRLH